MNKHYTKNPREHHAKCKIKGCNNYYHQLHSNTERKCKPCRTKNRKENNA